MKCPEGQILSYSIDSHTMEDPVQCGTSSDVCVDSLTLYFPGMGATQTTCGTLPSSPTITDGSNELIIEFMSNRAKQHNGFLLLAWCIDPAIKKSSSPSGTRSKRQQVTCNTPTAEAEADVWKRDSDWENKTNDTALLKLVR